MRKLLSALIITVLMTIDMHGHCPEEITPFEPVDEDSTPGRIRAVFLGDSIFEGWPEADPGFFEGSGYVCKGVGGETTGQILARFNKDVLSLQPDLVVIMAGTNDIAGNMGEVSDEEILDNLEKMLDIAIGNGITPVVCSILPAHDYPWNQGTYPARRITELNRQLERLASVKGCGYTDLYSVTVDGRGGLPASLSEDGVHPNAEGYRIMREVLEKVLVDFE